MAVEVAIGNLVSHVTFVIHCDIVDSIKVYEYMNITDGRRQRAGFHDYRGR